MLVAVATMLLFIDSRGTLTSREGALPGHRLLPSLTHSFTGIERWLELAGYQGYTDITTERR